jgi:hypothetical protein
VRDLLALVEEKLELLNGYALRFPAQALEAVERFAWSERQRQPLASLEIRFSGVDQAVWLTVTGASPSLSPSPAPSLSASPAPSPSPPPSGGAA